MEYKVLSVGRDHLKIPRINIGDYVQALASSQFLPSIDGFLDRDEDLKDYIGPECKIIMNGWYMHKPENWPPSSRIIPLFVAFHINPPYFNDFKKRDSLNYLRKYEPIGCRDFNTVEFLRQNGIDAYYTGCMTLTLGVKYCGMKRTDKIYFVDPYVYYPTTFSEFSKSLLTVIKSPKIIHTLWKKHHDFSFNALTKLHYVCSFYRQYRNVVDENILLTANYEFHESNKYRECASDEMSLLKEAEKLVKKYSVARLVITSRIHCGLPCLGLNTPVLFIQNKQADITYMSRWKGLLELFNVIEANKGVIEMARLTESSITEIKNKDSWKIIASQLIETVKKFVENNRCY